MVKKCESCDKFTSEDAAAFCLHCGNRFPEDPCVLLHQIRDSVDESQEEIRTIRILLRKSQKKTRLGKPLTYVVIAAVVIILIAAFLFFQAGARF
ncbi:MAG TPA: hypothetical protein VFC43_03985 [Methanoregula sp.]|nr:hypothetical protein [Methanoregula sp.]